MKNIAIKLENISKFYKLYASPKDRLKEALHPFKRKYHKKFYALKNINLEVKKGEILGIVGHNGSGKSTLLKLICGILVSDSGKIKVDGKISALLELGAGFNPEFTGMQNIYFFLRISEVDVNEIEAVVQKIINFAEIGDFINQPIKHYSSGMRARLGFAVAIHIDPEILILDEVLAVGDDLFKRKCYVKMKELFNRGKTILFVSHDVNSVNHYCTRAILLDQGEKLLDSDPKTVTLNYHKLIFSNIKKRQDVRAEILTGALSVNNKKPEKISVIDDENHHDSYYIPELKPTTTTTILNHDVAVTEPYILNSEGIKVNALTINQTYVYTFKVIFNMSFERVSFGMQIKDIKGVKITGVMLQNEDKFITVKKDETYDIEVKFVCRLLHGTYYTNSVVTALINDENVILNKQMDAMIFKVLKEKNSLYGGLVHLNQEITCKVSQ